MLRCASVRAAEPSMAVSDTHPTLARDSAVSVLASLGRHGDRALFLVSVLGLYTELMLIRWVATEMRIFAYLQNTVLVVCFLGLGMGCFTCRQSASFRPA